MKHHRKAVITVTIALIVMVICGIWWAHAEGQPAWHGLFCSLANGTTDGCDVTNRTAWGFRITAIEYFTVVPLFGASLSFFTSGVTAGHVEKAEGRIKAHVEERLKHHLSNGG